MGQRVPRSEVPLYIMCSTLYMLAVKIILTIVAFYNKTAKSYVFAIVSIITCLCNLQVHELTSSSISDDPSHSTICTIGKCKLINYYLNNSYWHFFIAKDLQLIVYLHYHALLQFPPFNHWIHQQEVIKI